MSVAFSTFTAWLSPPSGPKLLHPQEKLCVYQAVIPTTPSPAVIKVLSVPVNLDSLLKSGLTTFILPWLLASLNTISVRLARVYRLYQMFIFKEHYTMVLVIRLSLDGHLGPFYLLALAHSAHFKLGYRSCLLVYPPSILWFWIGSGTAGPCGVSVFIFFRFHQTVCRGLKHTVWTSSLRRVTEEGVPSQPEWDSAL